MKYSIIIEGSLDMTNLKDILDKEVIDKFNPYACSAQYGSHCPSACQCPPQYCTTNCPSNCNCPSHYCACPIIVC